MLRPLLLHWQRLESDPLTRVLLEPQLAVFGHDDPSAEHGLWHLAPVQVFAIPCAGMNANVKVPRLSRDFRIHNRGIIKYDLGLDRTSWRCPNC